jgi:hypothetical protein
MSRGGLLLEISDLPVVAAVLAALPRAFSWGVIGRTKGSAGLTRDLILVAGARAFVVSGLSWAAKAWAFFESAASFKGRRVHTLPIVPQNLEQTPAPASEHLWQLILAFSSQ